MRLLLLSLFVFSLGNILKLYGQIEKTNALQLSIQSKEAKLLPQNNNNDLLKPDLVKAKELDRKWLVELYNNQLYDTIYKSVSELTYQYIDYADLPTDTLKKRLKNLNANTPFNIEYNAALESVIKQYLKYRKSTFEKLMGLSHYYFPMFEEIFDKHNIPLEIKYLAVVESALKPAAQSRAGAKGLWQFMFSTGKLYNLNVSSYVDERSDPLLATEAAAQYLSKLYSLFGDWDLALAAYNSGPGNVTKAIRRSNGYENYWNIRQHLPTETAGYVPAFLATMYIFEYAKEHGFKAEKPKFHLFETDTVHVKHMITLQQVSQLINTPLEVLQFLNPSYKLDIIPKLKDKTYTLRLPKEAIGVFVTNEDKIYAYAKAEIEKQEKPLPQFVEIDSRIRYRVKSGDYLGKIANKYGVRVSQIKRWNGLRSNNLKIGQRLIIYPKKPGTSHKSSRPKINNSKNKKTYVVKAGDSLWSIAQKFSGISVEKIKEWNGISGNNLKIGTDLIVSE